MNSTREIPLTKNKVAIVDSGDYDFLMSVRCPWRAMCARGKWYAVTRINGRDVSMQNLLITAPLNYVIDHRDRNGLNNRRSNLRIATQSQNIHNRGMSHRNKSGFRGVYWHTAAKKWRSQIGHNMQSLHLGLFTSPEDAARAYDVKARELLGEFAQLNFPES